MTYDAVIIGGGAAGLLCAGYAGRRGLSVLVAEGRERPARKILVTGKGRCNLTNNCPPDEVLKNVMSNPRFLYSALSRFGPALTRYARAIARDGHEAADIAQQTWLKALEHAGELASDAYIAGAGTTLDDAHYQSLVWSNNEVSIGMLYNLGDFRTYKELMRKYFTMTDEEIEYIYFADNYYCTRMMVEALQYLYENSADFEEMIDYMKGLTDRYPFVFVEDMLDENDWDGFALAHKTIDKTLIIADDFTVTNKTRLARAVSIDSIDGFILKPNQVGTITEALEAHAFAKEHGLFSIPSGRSGGVIGDVVMDLAVGLQVPFIKNGCPRSGERIDKLNFLMRVKDSYPGCHMANIDHVVKF